MPITLNSHNGSAILEVVVSGKLVHEDYERFLPEVERMVAQHGKISVLFDMVDFHGWEASALWDDTKFAFKHFCGIERIAIVGDHKWEEGMSVFCRVFTTGEVRYFDWTKLVQAREWLGESRREALQPIPVVKRI